MTSNPILPNPNCNKFEQKLYLGDKKYQERYVIQLALRLKPLPVLVRLGFVVAKPDDRRIDLRSVWLRWRRILSAGALPLVRPRIPLTVVRTIALLLVVVPLWRTVPLVLLVPSHVERAQMASLVSQVTVNRGGRRGQVQSRMKRARTWQTGRNVKCRQRYRRYKQVSPFG